MSATRDKSQRVTFVYSNLYQIYKKGVQEAKKSAPASPQSAGLKPGLRTDEQALSRLNRSHVLRSGELKYGVKVRDYQPTEFIAKRVTPAEPRRRAPQAPASRAAGKSPVESLKDNLKKLQDLHSRLEFMLGELEDLAGEKK